MCSNLYTERSITNPNLIQNVSSISSESDCNLEIKNIMMKKLNLVIAVAGCVLFSTQLIAQRIKSSTVPAVVSSALVKKYPVATKIIFTHI